LKQIRHMNVSTRTIAEIISSKLDVPYYVILEVLEEEKKYMKDMIKKGYRIEVCNLVVFEPYITKFKNIDCKTKLSRMFRAELREEDNSGKNE